jgi:hypothetical protein
MPSLQSHAAPPLLAVDIDPYVPPVARTDFSSDRSPGRLRRDTSARRRGAGEGRPAVRSERARPRMRINSWWHRLPDRTARRRLGWHQASRFPPALLGRLLVLPYYPLSPEMLSGIVRLQLGRIARRVRDNHAIVLRYDDAVVDHIVARCTEIASGGRMIDAILTNTMLPAMSIALLERQMRGEEVVAITVGGDEDALTIASRRRRRH